MHGLVHAQELRHSIPVLPVTPDTLSGWVDGQPERVARWVSAQAFRGAPDKVLSIPDEEGGVERVLYGRGPGEGPWPWAALRGQLPRGSYRLEGVEDPAERERVALAWALAGYRFDRYRSHPSSGAELEWPGCDEGRVLRLADGVCLARDLVNTPAEDLGPGELAGAVDELGSRHGAKVSILRGQDLLDENYPSVHAVGRAASREPRLADLTWGDPGAPKLTLVGKGVVFDSGGLDIKPAEGMKLMKKDMGGAAAVIGLAHAVMDARLPVRLRVLVPAVENAIAGNAFRPMDVLSTRKGITVEVGNTDAEGRLILCDALFEADSEEPDLILDFATLTGAARVALGTELPALFAQGEDWCAEMLEEGVKEGDPLWRMPLHRAYRRFLDSPVADLNNIGSSRTGGAITAALFLNEFVDAGTNWGHVDTMGWNEHSRPGRPAGGEGFGIRAAYAMLERRYGKG